VSAVLLPNGQPGCTRAPPVYEEGIPACGCLLQYTSQDGRVKSTENPAASRAGENCLWLEETAYSVSNTATTFLTTDLFCGVHYACTKSNAADTEENWQSYCSDSGWYIKLMTDNFFDLPITNYPVKVPVALPVFRTDQSSDNMISTIYPVIRVRDNMCSIIQPKSDVFVDDGLSFVGGVLV